MKTSNEFIARQIEQSGELVECIRSGQASAEQVEAHYAAGDVMPPLPRASYYEGHAYSADQMRAYAKEYAAPALPVQTVAGDAALQAFTEYFVKNYPGPDTIIHDPRWHAPKIFKAAINAAIDAGGKK